MTGNPIKVLHVIHWPVSGIVSLMKNVIASFPKEKVESHIIFFYPDTDTLEDFRKICKSASSLNLDHSYVDGIVLYRSLLKKISPDILHTHSFSPMIWGTLFIFGTSIKQITTIHSHYPYFKEKNVKATFKRNIQKMFLNLFQTKVVAVSRIVLSVLLDLGVRKDQLFLIENGIPMENCSYAADQLLECRRELNIGPDDVLIVTLGRLDYLKGYHLLIEAFFKVYQCHRNVKLMFIGDGPAKHSLMERANHLGIGNQVRFLGYKKNPGKFLACSNIYMCSSLVEGFSLAVSEAMLNRLPVVATRVGSNPDLIEHGVSGLLIRPNDTEEIVQALNDLLDGRYDRDLLGEKAKDSIKRYDVRKTALNYVRLYQDATDDFR